MFLWLFGRERQTINNHMMDTAWEGTAELTERDCCWRNHDRNLHKARTLLQLNRNSHLFIFVSVFLLLINERVKSYCTI